MAANYVMNDNSLSVEYREENIDKKYPALQLAIKVNGIEHKAALWIRNSNYGLRFSSNDAKAIIGFVRALFGAGAAATTNQPADKQPPPQARKKSSGSQTPLIH